MKKYILPFNWREELANLEADAIGDDFILLDKPLIPMPSWMLLLTIT